MPKSENLVDKGELTAEERINLSATHRWVELYNGDDMHEFVHETYHPEMNVTLFDGTVFNGTDVSVNSQQMLIAAEEVIYAACPGRRLVIERAIPAGHTVTVESILIDVARPEFRLAWCAVLTFSEGKIISDHSYLNHREWPALLKSIGQG